MTVAALTLAAVLALLAGVPIVFVFLGLAFLLAATDPFVSLGVVPRTFLMGLDAFVLLSIPLFVLVGGIMSGGSITSRLLDLAIVVVGHFRAGLAHVNIVASLIFSGISGTTSSDVAGLGRIEIPMMVRAGYRPETAATITAVSACIGPLVPPSVPFILYGALTGTSIGKLFLAGALPGVVLGITLMGVVAWQARTGRIESSRFRESRTSLGELKTAFQRSALALVTPIILVGGIVFGVFTPTEAGAIAVVYALLVSVGFYRELKPRELVEIFCDAAELVGVIMVVVGAAASFGWILIQMGAADRLLELVVGLALPQWQTLLVVVGALLLLGLFIEATSMIILLSPILAPLVAALELDPVHFGVVFTLAIMIAVITPPIGICSYIAGRIAGVSMRRLSVEMLPYLVAMIVFLVVVAFVPWLSTFLPALLFNERP